MPSSSRLAVRKDISPCVARTRAAAKGYYVSNRGTMLTTRAMLALQGVPVGRLSRPRDVTERAFDAAIGNAVTIPVLASVLRKLCIAVGWIV